MKPYKSLYYENKNDYDSSLSKIIFKDMGKPNKVTLTDLYKIKSIKDLKNYFRNYSLIETTIMVKHQKNNTLEQFKTDYLNNRYDNAIKELIRYIGVTTQNIARNDKLFKTKTTVKDVLDKIIELNNKLKNTPNFEKDIGY